MLYLMWIALGTYALASVDHPYRYDPRTALSAHLDSLVPKAAA